MQIGNVDHRQETIHRAAESLNAGQLVVFPTETVYGIAASAASEKGIDALRTFKGRPVGQPFTIHVPDPAAAERYIGNPHRSVRRLIRKTFPGPVTLVVEVKKQWIRDLIQALDLPSQTYESLFCLNTVGLRCPDSPIARQILAAIDAPVIASSANARGQPPPRDAEEAKEAVGDAAALVVDDGPCRFAKPSSVIRISQDKNKPSVRVERVGVYDERYIHKLMRWTVLMVCSGNTCRSPMAEAIAKQILADQLKLGAIHELQDHDIRVHSAGLFAATGGPANPEALREIARRGIDLSSHRSQVLTPQLVHDADVCYCMTEAHRRSILQMVPGMENKVLSLAPERDVEDPIGSGPDGYQRCADVIHRYLTRRLKEQQL